MCVSPRLLRPLVIVAALAALTACGRRGALEPPGASARTPPGTQAAAPAAAPAAPNAAVTAQAVPPDAEIAADEDDESVAAAPVPSPSGRRRKGYTTPRGPFILDPLL